MTDGIVVEISFQLSELKTDSLGGGGRIVFTNLVVQ